MTVNLVKLSSLVLAPRAQQRKPQNQVKLKSLVSGKTFAATFHVSDKADEADIEKRDVKFLYANKGEFWFADPEDPKNRFKLDQSPSRTEKEANFPCCCPRPKGDQVKRAKYITRR